MDVKITAEEQFNADTLVKSWFDEFELDETAHESLLTNKLVRPLFDFNKSKYLARYILHCPKFKELFRTQSEYSTGILWEIKEFKRKLTRKGLIDVSTLVTCKNCNGYCGTKACERGRCE